MRLWRTVLRPQRQPCPDAPVSPDHFHPVFAEVVSELERSDGLKDFRQFGDHVLIALDGTEYHVSGKVHCQHCSTRKRGKDRTEHFHAMVSATIVAPDHNRVVPLEPEFIVPQDGNEKQDCESRSAGLSAMSGSMLGVSQSIWAMTCSPANRSAKRCGRWTGISCSCASPRPTRRSRNTSPVSVCRR